jgi:hypothetical protein
MGRLRKAASSGAEFTSLRGDRQLTRVTYRVAQARPISASGTQP